MKAFLLALCLWAGCARAWAQANDSTETFEPAPYQLRFQSFEAPKATGALVLPLVLDAQRDLETVGYQPTAAADT